VKQTHKFFGSERQHAGTRGIQIPDIFTGKLADYPNVEIMWNTNASGFYDSGELVIEDEKRFMKILAQTRDRGDGRFREISHVQEQRLARSIRGRRGSDPDERIRSSPRRPRTDGRFGEHRTYRQLSAYSGRRGSGSCDRGLLPASEDI